MTKRALIEQLRSHEDDLEYYRRANKGTEQEQEWTLAAELIRETIATLTELTEER